MFEGIEGMIPSIFDSVLTLGNGFQIITPGTDDVYVRGTKLGVSGLQARFMCKRKRVLLNANAESNRF